MLGIEYSDIFAICLIMIVVLLCAIALLVTFEYIKKNKYQREKDMREFIGLDSQREFYEKKIYEFQKQMSENERRWRDVNNLVLSGQTDIRNDLNIDCILDIPFFRGLGISKDEIKIDKKSVFVLTPFIETETKTYMAIQEICNAVGLNCRRGDEVYRNNDLLVHIVREIVQSRVIVANINGRNPNVFYELGICHAIGKSVIIVSSIKDEIPFDVGSKNIVIYKDIDSLKSQLKDELLKMFIDESSI